MVELHEFHVRFSLLCIHCLAIFAGHCAVVDGAHDGTVAQLTTKGGGSETTLLGMKWSSSAQLHQKGLYQADISKLLKCSPDT